MSVVDTALGTGGEQAEDSPRGAEEDPSRWRGRRRWRALRRDIGFWSGLLIVTAISSVALSPGVFARLGGGSGDPEECDLQFSGAGPDASSGHPFGYTVQGCDLFTHVVYGAGNSLFIGVTGAFISALIGVTSGMIAGYRGGWVDVVISRLSEVIYSIPFLLGAIVILTTVGSRTPLTVAATIAVLGWIWIARIVRANTMSLRTRNFVVAAHAMGLKGRAIMFRHILPNTIGPVLVIFTTTIGSLIGAEASLTYLGVGLQQPAISWGLQLSSAQRWFSTYPHLLFYPMGALVVTVAGFVLLGDALRRVLSTQRDSV